MTINIQQQIQQAGLKVTQARIAVMLVLKNQAGQLSVKEIYQSLYRHHAQLSLTTVYRVLKDLENVELVFRNQLHQGEAQYALPDHSTTQSLHIQCHELSMRDQRKLIDALKTLFMTFHADVLNIEFKH